MMKTKNQFINLKKASKNFRRFEDYKKHLHILYSYLVCDRKKIKINKGLYERFLILNWKIYAENI